MMKATAGAGIAAAGMGAGLVGSAAGNLASFQDLSTENQRIVNESGETFKMRGLNIPDPKRMARTNKVRGKTRKQLIDMLTNNANGWHPRAIRIPAQPTDIGEHPNGNTGPAYGSDSPPEIDDDRTKMIPAQPKAWDDDDEMLETYLRDHYDPVVQRCKERGVYCIIDWHRHWHEQPPGDGQGGRWDNLKSDAEAENHVPYNSEYALYWAKNDYYDEDKPTSWGWVDARYRSVNGNATEQDIANGNTPYDQWSVNQDLVDEAIDFWDIVAERYADEPHVIFEPYNEPTAPGIWGPVSGCGAHKQKPLWDTYIDEFATPIMDAVREHAPEKLMLMGLPGWCQATQGLNWRGFDHDNVAAVYHNYAGHSASKEENWHNAPATGCQGWEPVESQGIQEAYEVHPIAITEFGWQDPDYTQANTPNETDISKWLQGSTTGQGTTEAYGKPAIEAWEEDERISWVAWCADPRWLTAMFKVDYEIAEKTLDLQDGNWYTTDPSEYPENCSDLPCDWALWQNPNMGQHTKDKLAEFKDDGVPFDMQEVTGGCNANPGQCDDGGTPQPPTTTEPPSNGDCTPSDHPAAPELSDGTMPRDTDGDGFHEDFNENCRLDSDDVVQFFERKEDSGVSGNPSYYDLNDNNRADFDDVVQMFGMI